jgi:olefin beta-lactone synthetase
VTRNPNIAARLVERAERHPDRAAIIEGRGRRRRVVRFGELADRVAAAGHRLRDRGLEPGDRALLFVPMSADLYTVMLGVLHTGGVAVFLDAWSGRDRLEAAVDAAAPRAFIGTWRAMLLRMTSRALRRIPLATRPGPLFHGDGRGAAATVADGEDHALVTFTTGSTGRPRAAARSHDFLWAQHRVLARHLALRDDDIDMPTLPVFVLNNLALGITTVLPDFDPRRPADIDPARVLRQMRDEGVTTTSGSPAFYDRLARHVRARGTRIPVRALFTGGAPVFPPLARSLAAAAEGEVHVLYGSTEAEPIASIPALDLARLSETAGAPGVCAGRPVDEIEVRIAPVPGRGGPEAGVPTGELLVAGEHVLRGYLNDPEGEAAAKIREGDRVWHRTGDGGLVDDAGRLWLLGRLGQRVEREDGTWWPMAAEARALGLAGVRHAAYLGVAGGSGPGPEVRAVLCLELEPGAQTARPHAELEQRVRAALGPIPVDEVRVMRRIPRDPRHASKTDASRLRRLLDRG